MRQLNELKDKESFSTKKTLKSNKLLTTALAFVLVAGMASPAYATIVDNFDEGAIFITTSGILGSNTANSAGLDTANTIGGDRDVMITSDGPGGVTANLISNDFMTLNADGTTTGDYMLIYDGVGVGGLGGIDLTVNGQDRVVITFVDADFAGDVTVRITEQNGEFIEETQVTGGGMDTLTFLFASMTGTGDQTTPVDADIIKISIDSKAITMADYTIDKIDIPQRMVGGNVGSIGPAALLVAGAEANMGMWSLALVGAVAIGAVVTYKVKSKKTEQ